MSRNLPDDRILPVTRWVLAAVNVALLVAFVLLYLFPQATRATFAWEIKPYLTAVFMGSGYFAGAFMFMFAIFGQKWHRVKHSLPPVAVFAAVMLLVTLLHYDRFIHTNPAFILWLVIYIVTPLLVPWLWWNNRAADPGDPEPRDRLVPLWVRGLAGLIGAGSLLFYLAGLLNPPFLIERWPWPLTPLTARTVCAWGILVSTGGIVIFLERRWSGWRYTILAIALWQALMVFGSIAHRQDFHGGSLLNAYFLGICALLAALSVLVLWMEKGARRL